MEKCKFCQEELAEGSTVCPHCGKDNAPEIETETVTPAEEVSEETTVVEETADEKTETEAPVEEEAGAARYRRSDGGNARRDSGST